MARALDPAAAILSVSSLEAAMAVFLLPQRIGAWVTGLIGAFGLLLGGIGIYSLTAYRVVNARRELGVRMALGAGPTRVLLDVLRGGLVAPLVGAAAGLVLVGIGTRFLQAFLFGVHPLDPVTLAGVLVVLVSLSVAANLIPARTAARTNPSRVLQGE